MSEPTKIPPPKIEGEWLIIEGRIAIRISEISDLEVQYRQLCVTVGGRTRYIMFNDDASGPLLFAALMQKAKP